MTENKKKQYEYLKEQDNNHQLCVMQYPKMHLQLQNIIKSLKHDLQVLSLKREERITKLKMQNMRMKKRIKDIKNQFYVNQVLDSLQLKKLTVTSNNALKDLRRIIQKNSIIFEIIRICSPLEPILFNTEKQFVQSVECSEFLQNIVRYYAKGKNLIIF